LLSGLYRNIAIYLLEFFEEAANRTTRMTIFREPLPDILVLRLNSLYCFFHRGVLLGGVS